MKTEFHEGNPATGELGTIVSADFLNAVNNHRHTGRNIDGDGALDYAVATGAANAYAITLTPALDVYINGMPIVFKANHTNTGPATLAVNGMTPKTIKKNINDVNEDLAAGDIKNGQLIMVFYDGTNFQIAISTPLTGVLTGNAGTKAWFWQNTAPVGWTIDASAADAVLAVKGGANAYNANGGTQQGTWTQPNHTHTTGDVTLTAAQSGFPGADVNVKATNAHDEMSGGGVSGGYIYTAGDGAGGSSVYSISSQGASQAHNHGATQGGATANTWRPLAQVGIICTKN